MNSEIKGEVCMYINGELTQAISGKTYENINPATEEVIGVVADASRTDMEHAIAAARRAFDSTDWSTNHGFRLTILKKFAAAIKAAANDVLRPQIIAEAGQPYYVTLGPGCDAPIEHLDWVLDTLANYRWERDLPNIVSNGVDCERKVWKEAVGVIGAITPWNFPLQTNLAKIFPALAAGNTVVLKPAPDTPWTATALGKIAYDIGLPAGVLNIVTSSDPAEVGEVLTADSRVDMITFTGSTAIGKRIMSVCSATVKKVFLELGGKSANIILDDANLSLGLLHGLAVCYHAGQGCAIDTRMLIPKSRYQEAVDILTPIFQGMSFGDPTDPQFIMGPVINKKQYHKILGMIQNGIEEGATLAAGGVPGDVNGKGYFIKPTLFTHVHNDMMIAQQEIFGPVLVMISYEDDEDAIRIANDSVYGLSGSIHSASNERALAMAKRIRTGTLNINGGTFYGGDAPFGGVKQSGIGREMGLEGFEEYLDTKCVGYPA